MASSRAARKFEEALAWKTPRNLKVVGNLVMPYSLPGLLQNLSMLLVFYFSYESLPGSIANP